MPSSYVPLVKDAITLLDKFYTDKLCLDDFVEDSSKDLQNLDPQHKSFILDTVSGCIEHKQLLDVVLTLFCRCAEECVPKSDLSLYLIVCYLTTCLLDQLGLKCFGSIVKSLGVHKVQTFLLFFFSNLTTRIQVKWESIYDAEHVQKQWIEPTLRWRPEIVALLEQLSVQVSRVSEPRKTPNRTTEPWEFALTKAKPRAFPLPEIIPEPEKQRPVPRTTYKAPKEMKIMEDIKQKNQRKAERLLYLANVKQFESAKSKHYQKVVSEIEESMNSKLKFNSFQSSRVPSTIKQAGWDIKLNSAAILRQGAVVDRQLKQELHRMERLTEGTQEPSAFLQWQKEMRERDLQEDLAKVECRRLEGRISREEAAMARSHLMAQKHTAALLKKEEVAVLMRQYAEKRMQEEKEMRKLVQQVTDGHKNAKAAKEKLCAMKQKIVREVSEESQELLRRALAEAQAELVKKFEIIKQIRAIESNSHTRDHSFDDTKTGGHDLLGEMSLCELRERLAQVKEAQLQEEQQRRQHIHEQKQQRKLLLQQKLDTFHLHHATLKQATGHRKEQIKQTVAVNETVLALQKKLEEKKHERSSLRHRDSSRPAHSERTLSSERVCEQKDWAQLEQTLGHHIQKHTAVSLM